MSKSLPAKNIFLLLAGSCDFIDMAMFLVTSEDFRAIKLDIYGASFEFYETGDFVIV